MSEIYLVCVSKLLETRLLHNEFPHCICKSDSYGDPRSCIRFVIGNLVFSKNFFFFLSGTGIGNFIMVNYFSYSY